MFDWHALNKCQKSMWHRFSHQSSKQTVETFNLTYRAVCSRQTDTFLHSYNLPIGCTYFCTPAVLPLLHERGSALPAGNWLVWTSVFSSIFFSADVCRVSTDGCGSVDTCFTMVPDGCWTTWKWNIQYQEWEKLKIQRSKQYQCFHLARSATGHVCLSSVQFKANSMLTKLFFFNFMSRILTSGGEL